RALAAQQRLHVAAPLRLRPAEEVHHLPAPRLRRCTPVLARKLRGAPPAHLPAALLHRPCARSARPVPPRCLLRALLRHEDRRSLRCALACASLKLGSAPSTP